MKEYLIKILCFLLFPILFIVAIESYLAIYKDKVLSETQLNKRFGGIADDYAWMDKIESKNKILLTGSSSVRYGLSCSVLNTLSNDSLSFINLAMDARGPIATYFLLKNINLDSVDKVYFGLDPWIYTKTYYKYRPKYLYLDLDFFEALAYYKESNAGLFLSRYIEFFSYIFSSNRTNSSNDQANTKIPADFGSIALTKTAINFTTGNMANDYQIEKHGWSKLQFKYLKKISTLCKNEEIEFITFIPPKRSDYSVAYQAECSQIHQSYIENIVNEKLNNPIFGTFNQLDNLDDFSLFAEAYHLNSVGQKVYSEIFFNSMLSSHKTFSADYPWFK